MPADYWLRQTSERALYEDMLWSRPENRLHAGKLLVIGGHAQGFAAPADAFRASQKAGIGTARVLLPDSIQKLVGPVMENGEFASSTPAGSFAQDAYAELASLASWSDGVLVAGDLGRNSETAILLEKFATKYAGQLTITKDAGDYFCATPQVIEERHETTLVISFAQLQRLGVQLGYASPFTFNMDLLRLIDTLHEFTNVYPFYIVTKHLDNFLVAAKGQISTTKTTTDIPIWRVDVASYSAVWWLQNPARPFEALTTAVYDYLYKN